MALIVKKPKGTEDIVPSKVYKWHTVEKIVSEAAEIYGFKEIRVPTFEETGLFVRSVGETTDVVQKEMYSVSAAGDSKFALRPEGTSGTMRAVLENGILNEGLPQKVYYILSCFRHENTQKGRLREFHQFGCEMVGSESPRADAEVISLAKSVLDRAGLRNIKLNINSIGCPTCRAEYRKALKEYFAARKDQLCETCRDRLDKNPMRILDCKIKHCQELGKDAPVILDYLCDDCKEHFEKLQEYLSVMGIDFDINPKIVRGLDYYTRTVFEFITDEIGAQGTVCGGGRYDGLIHLYIVPMGEDALKKAMGIASELREEGCFVEYDLIGKGLNAQMKYANKTGAKFVMVLGDNEIESGVAKLKNMATGEQTDIRLDNTIAENFSNALMADMFKDIDADIEKFIGKEN